MRGAPAGATRGAAAADDGRRRLGVPGRRSGPVRGHNPADTIHRARLPPRRPSHRTLQCPGRFPWSRPVHRVGTSRPHSAGGGNISFLAGGGRREWGIRPCGTGHAIVRSSPRGEWPPPASNHTGLLGRGRQGNITTKFKFHDLNSRSTRI